MLLLMVLPVSRTAFAQVTPAAGYTPPDDTPSIRVGITLFPSFTYQTTPTITDADGNVVNKNSFDVTRAYLNFTGNVSHIIAFRITPDITRQSGLLALGAGNSVSSDSLVFRIKYAYAQFNLDDWMTKGSWTRIGIQQTPWDDFDEGIYRYRFQGTTFAERLPLPTTMTSSDAGVSFHYNLPSNYGDFHFGVYNGENYQKVEVNDQKALEFRGTLRPFATSMPVLRGVRAHLVYYNDNYQSSDERKRVMGNVTFEHQYLNAEFDYLSAKDEVKVVAQTTANRAVQIQTVTSAEEILEFQRLVRMVPIAESVEEYVVNLVRGTRPTDGSAAEFVKKYVNFGASVRAAQFIVLGAKVRALSRRRYRVAYEDITALAAPVLRHRILLNFHAESEHIDTDEIIRRLLAHMPPPATKD